MRAIFAVGFLALSACGGGGASVPVIEPYFGLEHWGEDRFYVDTSQDRWLGVVNVDEVSRATRLP